VDDLLGRRELADEEWARLAPLMPEHPRRGHRWIDHRLVMDGIVFRARAGCPWRDLPERFGNWKKVCGRHRRWSVDGTWEMILDQLSAGCDAGAGAGVDGRGGCDGRAGASACRRGLAVAAGRCGGGPAGASGAQRPGAREELSRMTRIRTRLGGRGAGLTGKIDLLANSGWRPLARVTSSGQRHGSLAVR
jgi:transposase